MATSSDLATAAANGDVRLIERLLQMGVDVNQRSSNGMTALSIAAFWGYSDITKILLKNGADVTIANKGTGWTPVHCAAFQGHGPVLMKLMEHQPPLTLTDSRGRTAVDFASALDSIWPIFAAAGCKRTTKSDLIKLDIVKKVTTPDPTIPKSDYAHFSRPGSAYVVKSQPLYGEKQQSRLDTHLEVASLTGDVLAMELSPRGHKTGSPSCDIWKNQ